MWYNDLRPAQEIIPNKYSLTFIEKATGNQLVSEEDKKRTLENLVTLKEGIRQKIPQKKLDSNILLATWNIKEFGHLEDRLPESYFYIAEIISAFDIVAVQEIKRKLNDLNIIMRLLGGNWDYIMTDITEGDRNNKERFGYIYDTRRVKLSGLSGEMVISPEIANTSTVKQLKRTPAITGFESSWKKFSVISLHLHPGDDAAQAADPNDPDSVDVPSDHDVRKEEVRILIELIKEKLEKKHFWNENLILLGDTNLYESDDEIVDLITNEGFKECEGLIGQFTNTSLSQIYDRIFLKVDRYFKLIKNENDVEKGGVFNLYDYVLRADQRAAYHDYMLQHKDNPNTLVDDDAFDSYFHRYWKRNQLSDHLPVWIEIEADSSKDFLKSKAQQVVV